MTAQAPASYATRRWNAITGCASGLPCWDRCWARSFARRHAGRFGYPKSDPFRPTFHPDRLEEPLRWRKPEVAAVSFMGDVGAPGVRDEWLCALWAVMALTPRHRYLVLTKRPERLAAWLGGGDAYDGVLRAADRIRRRNAKLTAIGISDPATVPLRNVVVGTSVSDQEQADARIQALLSVPAWLRWASHEPATGPVDFSPWIVKIDHCKGCGEEFQEKGHLKVCPKCGEDSLITTWGEGQAARLRSGERYEDTPQAVVDRDEGPQLHWIVTGAESGPHRRPFDRAWARTTMEQCAQAGIPWYYKQGAVGYCTDPDRSCPVDCERLTCSLPVVKHPRLDGHEHTAVPWEAR